MSHWTDGLRHAGAIEAASLGLIPDDPPHGRVRHAYGHGPFAILRMPPLPASPGIYVWCAAGDPVYVGQTRGSLRSRLGSNGYSRISTYNTFARQPGKTNGGQQTNCRVNAMANVELGSDRELTIWYRVTAVDDASDSEADWMRRYGLPSRNRQDRR